MQSFLRWKRWVQFVAFTVRYLLMSAQAREVMAASEVRGDDPMRFLFNTTNSVDEQSARDMIHLTISRLRSIHPTERHEEVSFSRDAAVTIANLIDIGTAPIFLPLSRNMRINAHRFGYANLVVSYVSAQVLANHIEIGVIRHEAGFDDPKSVRIH